MRVPTATYISQKVRAIRAINETLQSPDTIPNDYTVTAVAIMTILEVCLSFSCERGQKKRYQANRNSV